AAGTTAEGARRDAALALARARAQMAYRLAADPRGALAWRQRQAAPAHDRRASVLGRRVPPALQDPDVFPGRGGSGAAACGQAAGRRAALVHHDPRALERGHGVVELLPGQGPRSAGV